MDLWFQNPTLNSTVHGQETQKNHPLIRTLYRSFLQFNRPQHKYWIKKKPTTPKAIKPRWNWKKILTPFRFLQQFRFQTQISLQEIRSNPDATPNKGNWNWNWNWNGFLKIGRNFFFFFFSVDMKGLNFGIASNGEFHFFLHYQWFSTIYLGNWVLDLDEWWWCRWWWVESLFLMASILYAENAMLASFTKLLNIPWHGP